VEERRQFFLMIAVKDAAYPMMMLLMSSRMLVSRRMLVSAQRWESETLLS